jgi:alcohol dehydrogenase class IV
MPCCHSPELVAQETVFSVDLSSVSFGPGVLAEAGPVLASSGARRVALFTDPGVAPLAPVAAVARSIRDAGLDLAIFDQVHVEPTNDSFLEASRFAREGRFDGYVSVGGGSVIDTAKAAALYATHPADFLVYVNAPVGEGRPVPGPLPPHVACPTTCGTGSECTGIAVFDHLPLAVKTGIASRLLRPSRALVDPTCTHSLPAMVVAASGFDVLCHALESFTARPYTARARPASPQARPMSQGQNPWSDVGSREALRLAGLYLVRAVRDAGDAEARHGLAWAATLAGIAFGNSGVHLPHAMSYAVAGKVRDYRCPGYPQHEPLVPHGISVVVNAPSVFRFLAPVLPDRHLEAARLLSPDLGEAGSAEAPGALAAVLARLMRDTGVPPGTTALGYGPDDVPELARGALMQKRLVDNAPVPIDDARMRALFEGTLADG